jgi:hypothetical protein
MLCIYPSANKDGWCSNFEPIHFRIVTFWVFLLQIKFSWDVIKLVPQDILLQRNKKEAAGVGDRVLCNGRPGMIFGKPASGAELHKSAVKAKIGMSRGILLWSCCHEAMVLHTVIYSFFYIASYSSSSAERVWVVEMPMFREKSLISSMKKVELLSPKRLIMEQYLRSNCSIYFGFAMLYFCENSRFLASDLRTSLQLKSCRSFKSLDYLYPFVEPVSNNIWIEWLIFMLILLYKI